MKRISLCSGVAGLHARHRPSLLLRLYGGVHYSPYALNYYGSGLVGGYVTTRLTL